MSVSSVPKGGLNQGVIVPLIFQCPGDCECKSSQPKTWYHAKCGDPSFITEFGDILCKNHLKECSGYFFQDAFFQCQMSNKSNTWYQYKSQTFLLLALSFVINAAEFILENNDLNNFINQILKQVHKRWHN
ncbi:unnamed protein product [Paramecium primaurelia]|uniref:Uncharacterized protein n=1 Tax=Paramecium primaurelia TaxID=5886 RepID=A0A8S1PE87_PARPR|nr:unnamed protein product [Paramecium primaurelia]